MDGEVPQIANPALQSSVDHVLMQVNPENVLGVRKVLIEEAELLAKEIRKVANVPAPLPLPGRMGQPGYGVWVGRCSDDPVSGPAQISFNRKIAQAIEEAWKYVEDLGLAGEQLGAAARRYGYTENEIQSHFSSFKR